MSPKHSQALKILPFHNFPLRMNHTGNSPRQLPEETNFKIALNWKFLSTPNVCEFHYLAEQSQSLDSALHPLKLGLFAACREKKKKEYSPRQYLHPSLLGKSVRLLPQQIQLVSWLKTLLFCRFYPGKGGKRKYLDFSMTPGFALSFNILFISLSWLLAFQDFILPLPYVSSYLI